MGSAVHVRMMMVLAGIGAIGVVGFMPPQAPDDVVYLYPASSSEPTPVGLYGDLTVRAPAPVVRNATLDDLLGTK